MDRFLAFQQLNAIKQSMVGCFLVYEGVLLCSPDLFGTQPLFSGNLMPFQNIHHHALTRDTLLFDNTQNTFHHQVLNYLHIHAKQLVKKLLTFMALKGFITVSTKAQFNPIVFFPLS
jgi:hypothetical protein